jgi:hypothetical protein
MKGGAADLALYDSAGALPGTSTQVINTFGNIGQQTGSAGTNSGLIQPISNVAQPMKGGRGRKVKGGSAVAANAGLVGGNQLVTAPVAGSAVAGSAVAGSAVAGSAVAGSAVAHDSTNNIFPQSVPTKPISGGKRRKGKRSVKRGGGNLPHFTEINETVLQAIAKQDPENVRLLIQDDIIKQKFSDLKDNNPYTEYSIGNIRYSRYVDKDPDYFILQLDRQTSGDDSLKRTEYGDENGDYFNNTNNIISAIQNYLENK